MNNDFLPFELAVKLKEKGFNCTFPFGLYNIDKDFMSLYTSDKLHFQYSEYYGQEEYLIAPTISQVLKWLRKEKKIVISIFPHSCGWQADVYKNVHQYYDSEAECYLKHYYKEKTEISHSYNWLEIYCIQYVLDNLI